MSEKMTQEELERQVGHPLRRDGDIKLGDLPVTVGRLEQAIASTNLTLRDLASRTSEDMRDLASRTSEDISRLTKSIEEITKNQFLGKQTNWGMIASWAAVLVLLLGLVVYQPLQEIRTGIHDHKQDGHPTSVISRIENNEQRFVDIISRLQREVTLLEQADKERRTQLHTRLKETEDWILEHNSVSPKEHAILRTRLDALKERMDNISTSMNDHDKFISAERERMLNVEREIYTGATYRSGRPIKPPEK